MQKESTKLNEVEYQTKLAPIIQWDKGHPIINGPSVYGASPGKDFLYLIPTVGERPMRFFADCLPAGLFVEAKSGQIKGKVEERGEYLVSLKAKNKHGECTKTLKLIIEDNGLALTPPMGWNSWNCYRNDIDDIKIRAVANGMISSGLAARGYTYVNMDSGWQSAQRGGKHNSIVPKDEFPDMKALCDYIHSLGLKAGIYSGPYVIPWGTDGCGTTSGICDTNFSLRFNSTYIFNSKYIGMNKHEHEDVSQWAEWGFDYFKYDWSKTDMVLTERMSQELKKSYRDIVFSITTHVDINDASKVKDLVHLWRSNDDTQPDWDSVVDNGFKNQQWNPVIGSGHWLDLDMTAILPRDGKKMTQNELISCISCWMMRPSPILIDCDPTDMDDFTLSLLCNEEIIALNQDSLGKPAVSILKSELWDIQLKPLSDGNYALAFFNLSSEPAIAPKIDLAFFGVGNKFRIRDIWNKKDIGEFESNFVLGVDAHCAKVFKIFMS